MFWKSKEFDRVRQEWEQRLKKSGFRDIEKEIKGERVLSQYSDYAYRRKETELVRECKLAYFTLLAQHLSVETKFEDEWDQLIMERTAEGYSIKEISEELKSLVPENRERTKHNRDTIRYVRRRYEHRWGIKVWKPEEMQSRKARTR